MKVSELIEAKHIGNKMNRYYTPEPTDNVRCGKCKATYTMHRFLLRPDHPSFSRVSECPACREFNYHERLDGEKVEFNEAKHHSLTNDNLEKDIIRLVRDTFEEIYIDDYSDHEDYADAVITKIMKVVEKALPNELKEKLTNSIWSTYHHFEENDFVDTESFVDALINEIVNDLRFEFKRIAGFRYGNRK